MDKKQARLKEVELRDQRVREGEEAVERAQKSPLPNAEKQQKRIDGLKDTAKANRVRASEARRDALGEVVKKVKADATPRRLFCSAGDTVAEDDGSLAKKPKI